MPKRSRSSSRSTRVVKTKKGETKTLCLGDLAPGENVRAEGEGTLIVVADGRFEQDEPECFVADVFHLEKD